MIQCWNISTLTTILSYLTHLFSMRRFLSLFAVKYFKIEKTSEKKNYRGLQYLSDNKFIHPPGRHYRNCTLSQIIYTTVLNYTELELLLISYSTQFLRIHPMIVKGSNFGKNILLIWFKGEEEVKFLDIFHVMEIITNVTNMAVDSANLTCDTDFWGKSQCYGMKEMYYF